MAVALAPYYITDFDYTSDSLDSKNALISLRCFNVTLIAKSGVVAAADWHETRFVAHPRYKIASLYVTFLMEKFHVRTCVCAPLC